MTPWLHTTDDVYSASVLIDDNPRYVLIVHGASGDWFVWDLRRGDGPVAQGEAMDVDEAKQNAETAWRRVSQS